MKRLFAGAVAGVLMCAVAASPSWADESVVNPAGEPELLSQRLESLMQDAPDASTVLSNSPVEVSAEGGVGLVLPQSLRGEELTPAADMDAKPGLSITGLGGNPQVVFTLDDNAAPTRYPFELTGVDSAELDEESGEVSLMVDGNPHGVVSAPWAVDANGAYVATGYQVDGTTVTQWVAPDQNTEFPVVADPSICIFGMGDCAFDVKNPYGNTVHVSDYDVEHIEPHNIPRELIKKAIHLGYRDDNVIPHRAGDGGYSYLVREYRFTVNGGITPTGRTARIAFIVQWADGKADHGQLRTMYCKGASSCPAWVEKDINF